MHVRLLNLLVVLSLLLMSPASMPEPLSPEAAHAAPQPMADQFPLPRWWWQAMRRMMGCTCRSSRGRVRWWVKVVGCTSGIASLSWPSGQGWGALATRAFTHAGGDYYLVPLAQTGEVPELLARLLDQVRAKEQSLQPIWAPEDEGTNARPKLLALGFEATRRQEAEVDSQGMV